MGLCRLYGLEAGGHFATLWGIAQATWRRNFDINMNMFELDAAEGSDGPLGHRLVGPAVPLRVLRLPVPEVAAHRLECLWRVEPELFVRDGRVCDELRDVASSGFPTCQCMLR